MTREERKAWTRKQQQNHKAIMAANEAARAAGFKRDKKAPEPPITDLMDLSGSTSLPNTRLMEVCTHLPDGDIIYAWVEVPIPPEPPKKSRSVEDIEDLFTALRMSNTAPMAAIPDIEDLFKPIAA